MSFATEASRSELMPDFETEAEGVTTVAVIAQILRDAPRGVGART